MNFTILRFDRLGSTNVEAISQAKQGAPEGLTVVAREQSAGRGRHSRSWVSEKDAGLFFSVVLRPKNEVRFLPLLTMMAAVAVCETLREQDLDPDIKWPNDLLVNEKKICGVLAEMTETPTGTAIILGIGINLRHSNYLPEIAAVVTSVENETSHPPDSEAVLRSLTAQISRYYDIFCLPDGPAQIRSAWSERSSYFEGKDVKAVIANRTITGVTRGIEENGALRVETVDGRVEIIHAGDVERLRQA